MKRVLVIEDDPDIVLSLRHNLEREGLFEVTAARDGEAGLAEALRRPPDLVILDLGLPGLDGVELCRRLRREPETARLPIIMLTARVDEAARVAGLNAGADDYVAKPFSVRELMARVTAVLRRSEADPGDRLGDPPLLLDLPARRVEVDGRDVELTRREFDLLADLLRHRGRVLTRDRLLRVVWGYDIPGETRTVDVHVRKLRQKLGPAVAERLETVVGVGYRWRDGS
jgi:two-component system, OmpR family, alkaline phosphatase synthesis response regulator PhoP